MKRTALNKREFILSCPPNLSAREVVARGKKNGVELSQNYVYVVWSAEKRGPRTAGVTTTLHTTDRRKTARAALEQRFLSAAIDLGMLRAGELLAQVREQANA